MQLFPLDENGDVLRRMVEYGYNLSVPRDIDFVVVTPDNKSAQGFSETVRAWGLKNTIKRTEVVPSLPWEVIVVGYMLPTHEGITRLEERLAEAAALVGSRNDGWGCLQQD